MRQVASVGNLATEGRETSPLGASVPPKVSAPAKDSHHERHAVHLQLNACHVGMLSGPSSRTALQAHTQTTGGELHAKAHFSLHAP